MPSACSVEVQEKHLEIIHSMDKRIDKLITLQEITTMNVNKLTQDIHDTMCQKDTCDTMFERVRGIEDDTKHIEQCREDVDVLKDGKKELWFFYLAARHPKLVALMALGLYATTLMDVRKYLLKMVM